MWQISNTTEILTPCIALLKEQLSARHIVFTPDLSWESSQNSTRSWEVQTNDINVQDIPLILWNRSPVITDENFQERSRIPLYEAFDLSTLRLLDSFFGQTEIGCAYVSNSMAQIESLEVLYNSTIQAHKRVKIIVEPDVILPYTLEFSELDSHAFTKTPYFHILTPFTVKITGLFYRYVVDYPKLLTYQNELVDLYGGTFTPQESFSVPAYIHNE